MRKERTERFGRELFAVDDGGRPLSCKIFIRIIVVFAACKRDDLRGYVRAEFFLARRTFDDDVFAGLAFFESDKLERHDIRSLMQKLIKRMLSVRSRFSEYDGPRHIIDFFAEAVDAFTVRFHIELL